MSTETVPKGYKRTEVGVIPEDWEATLLDSLAKRGSGHTPDKQHPEYWNGDICWISLQDSDRLDKGLISDTAAKITPSGIANSSACLHPAGTVVLSRDAGVGKSAIMASDMAVSQHFMAWRCGQNLDNRYLYYWLQSGKAEFERIAMGNTIKTIGLPFFKSYSIAEPPKAEQQAIAAALSDADALIEALESLLDKKRQIKQGAMQELLTGKRRLPGFTGKWEPRKLGTIGSTYGGLTGKTKADFEVGTGRYVTFMSVMKDVRINQAAFGKVRVNDNETQNRVFQGDLIFNGSSETPEEVAMCALLVDEIENLYLNSFCFGFRIREESHVNGLYLAYYIRSRKGRELIKALAQGSTRYNMSKPALMDSSIPIPSLPEQTTIASVLSDMDSELEALEAKLDKARQVKQGMMQQLLTGKVRLV